MKAEYKRNLQNNYLILEIPEEAEESSYRLRMAEQNKIGGLLPFHSSRRNGVLQLHYEITSMRTLESIYKKKAMEYRDIVFVLSGIRKGLEELQRYLLNPAQIAFDPDYIFIAPDRKSVQLCYIPTTQTEMSITMLAEYFLKRLDHQDQQAVTLGYGFYKKAQEENFSIQKALRDLLSPVDAEDQSTRVRPQLSDHTAQKGISIDERIGIKEDCGSEAFQEQDARREQKSPYEVIHRQRKKERGRNMGKLFSVIHPAVLLSGLFVIVALELLFYLEFLNLTEAGGIFFLLISAEALINRHWRMGKEGKRERESRWHKGSRWEEKGRWNGESGWGQKTETELYEGVQEEMYRSIPRSAQIEETRCLVPPSENGRIRLICVQPERLSMNCPDIMIGETPVYIGKRKAESDIVLDSPTVSRIHARLVLRNGICYVKDLNSKNGTFCNGERLLAQAEEQIREGDTVAFAEIKYRAVQQ